VSLEARRCAWCPNEIPRAAQASARTCSKRCRQSLQRFRVGAAGATPVTGPMRFAYADPPYPGLSWRYYKGEEVDHEKLVARLVREYPDGWALSTSSRALREVLSMIPSEVEVRVASWLRGSRASESFRPRDAWEPVIVAGGRPTRLGVRDKLDNALVWGGRQHSHPDALIGMKSAAFCEWTFRMLGATRLDSLDDLFPGSGAVARAWSMYTRAPSRGPARPSRFAGAMGAKDARRR
jgi:hypothetical protein